MFGKVFLIFSLATSAFAGVANNNFELDGDAVASGGLDWNTLDSSYIYSGVVSDPAPQSIFTGGRSKDTNDVSVWKHTDGSVPDKDDITNAYAHASAETGDLTVYFGADRYANDGDVAVGFWFFQDNVQALTDGSFSGTHKDGDLLVIANFGSSEEVLIYEWQGGLQQYVTGQEGNDATCNPTLEQQACAISNSVTTTSPWPYLSKGGETDFPQYSFVEGGINLNTVFSGRNVPCFTSFMSVTRSSSSVNAQLKDFVVGRFEVCEINVNVNCTDARLAADTRSVNYNYTVVINNNGFGQLYDIKVYKGEDLVGSFDTLLVGETQDFSGSFTFNGLNTSVGPLTVRARPFPDSTDFIEDSSDISQCPVLIPIPSLSVNKTCDVYLIEYGGQLIVQVGFDGYVCNSGELVLDNIVLVDDKLGNDNPINVAGTLGLQECATYNGTYFPSNEEFYYTDNVFVTGEPSFDSVEATATAYAQCVLCP